ncbi:MAG: AbrB/MazE/SpoVT family DNA-binding domain-containing protein [Alphaproteobacteria bacterium]
MFKPLKVRKIGSSLGLVLPKELLTELGVTEGDALYPVRTPNGIEMTPYDPEFAEILEDSFDYMRRHRNAMRELAKR